MSDHGGDAWRRKHDAPAQFSAIQNVAGQTGIAELPTTKHDPAHAAAARGVVTAAEDLLLRVAEVQGERPEGEGGDVLGHEDELGSSISPAGAGRT